MAYLKLWIKHLIGKPGPADCNAGQDSITLILMHYKIRLIHCRHLVGVGDHTTDKVRLSFVQDYHQDIQLTLEI